MTIQIATKRTARTVLRAILNRIGDVRGRIRHRHRRPQRPTVLMFHAVTETAERDWGPWRYAVTPSEFEAAVKHLVETRTIVPLSDIVDWVRSGDPIPNDAVAITFDDGYENYATNALPVLRRHAAPSVVYLSSSLVGPDPKSPFEFRLAHALKSQLGSTVSIDRLGVETRIDTTADLVDAYDTIRPETKYRRVEFRNAVLSSIGGDEREPVPMLSWADVRSLTGDPLVTCGSHGADHIPYEMLSDDEQGNVIEASRTWFARLLGSSPEHFSFPYGSYDATTIEILKNAGVISGVTTRPRSLSPRDWDQPYTIPRVDGATASLREL